MSRPLAIALIAYAALTGWQVNRSLHRAFSGWV